MSFTAENTLLAGSILLFVSVFVGKTGFRYGVPTLLLFLLVGMFFGSDGLGYQFNNVKESQFIGMVALSIILYTGGMETKYKDIKPILAPGIVLSTLGVLFTTIITGLFIYSLRYFSPLNFHLTLIGSFLLASVMSSTDSASVFSLLRSRQMNLKHNLKPLLELESGSNDPIAYILTIIFIQIANTPGGFDTQSVITTFIIQIVVGLLCGYLIGKLTVFVLKRINMGLEALYPILLLSFVFFTFSFTDKVNGNGYLAVYLAGMIVGNAKRISNRKEIYSFMDGLTWLFQIGMFLCLGLLVNPKEMLETAAIAMFIGLFLIFFARPISVWMCLLPFRKMPRTGKLFISWVGLRGAVPIILATYPVVAGVDEASLIFNIVFFITILSLIIQGSSIPWVAKKLNLSLPMEKTGNDFGVELPEDLNSDLFEIDVDLEMLKNGDKLMHVTLPKGALVMIIKRDDDYIVPNGGVELKEGDKLLLIKEKKNAGLPPKE